MAQRTIQTLILTVDNEFGVLTRVTALVRRVGWNIKSLTVAETANPAISRLTISVECIDSTLPEVVDRLSRLACVRSARSLCAQCCIGREYALVSMPAPWEAVEPIALAFGAKRVGDDGAVLELADTSAALDAFLSALRAVGEPEVARSGLITLEKPMGRAQP